MKDFAKNIAALFKVKTIVTLAITASMCYGFLCGLISTEVFAATAGSVITYYFTKREDDVK